MFKKTPYKNESIKTFDKAFPYSVYKANKLYKNEFGKYVYVNQLGYLHTLIVKKRKNNKAIIEDWYLTATNMLRYNHTSYFDTFELAMEFIEYQLNRE